MHVGRADVVFFAKQKTAYDVRISDWSSDVCSSDLGERKSRERDLGDHPRPEDARQGAEPPGAGAVAALASGGATRGQAPAAFGPARTRHHRAGRRQDRTSVVSGKRVSGRVDPGGRRSIKKNSNVETNRDKDQ